MPTALAAVNDTLATSQCLNSLLRRYTVVEIMGKALAPDSDPHKVRGMYIMGENPAMSDPNLNHARHALASLQHLVVQDIFLTETAWLAHVGRQRARETRHRQQHRPHRATQPPGAATTGPSPRRPVDHPANGAPLRPRLEL